MDITDHNQRWMLEKIIARSTAKGVFYGGFLLIIVLYGLGYIVLPMLLDFMRATR